MKKTRMALIALCLAAASLLAEGYVGPGYAKNNEVSYRRAFYRDLSKKLGKNRADYPHLTDEEFANFRPVSTTGIGRGKLYRSSSPINPWGNRNLIADKAAEAAGVKTFVNLADTEQGMRAYRGFSSSYYSKQAIIALHLGVQFRSEAYRQGLARGIRLMARGEAPFLVHCDLGKDRAGFVCAILECLMGASAEEVTADYLVSFYNYFGIQPGTRDYEFVANNEIRGFLASVFGVKNIANADLARAAERYLLDIGVPAQDITALRAKLGPQPRAISPLAKF